MIAPPVMHGFKCALGKRRAAIDEDEQYCFGVAL